MHPSQEELLNFMVNPNLEGSPLRISRACKNLADFIMIETGETAHGAELTTGLRKLLEAKDAFVRASLP